MKGYNLNPVEKEFSWGKMNVINIGESGRGRFQETVPFHCPLTTNNFGITETKSGKPKIVTGKNEDNGGWLAYLSGEGCYTRGTYGSIYIEPKYIDYVEVIAKGYGAYGDAGRIGIWHEFLCKVSEGIFLKVRPAGGSSKIESYWLYFDTDKVHRVEKKDMAIFCEQMEVEQPPEEFKSLVALEDIDFYLSRKEAEEKEKQESKWGEEITVTFTLTKEFEKTLREEKNIYPEFPLEFWIKNLIAEKYGEVIQ